MRSGSGRSRWRRRGRRLSGGGGSKQSKAGAADFLRAVVPPRKMPTKSIKQHSFFTQKRAAEIRGKGHRRGGAGVQALPGILGLDQSVVPYLTDERILGPVHALFGDFFRIAGAGAIANLLLAGILDEYGHAGP